MQTSEDSLKAVRFSSRLAVFTSVADILNWLVSCPLADLKVLHSITDFDDDASAFMACASRAELGHFGESPVVHHKVDVRHAEASGIKLDEDIFGAWD